MTPWRRLTRIRRRLPALAAVAALALLATLLLAVGDSPVPAAAGAAFAVAGLVLLGMAVLRARQGAGWPVSVVAIAAALVLTVGGMGLARGPGPRAAGEPGSDAVAGAAARLDEFTTGLTPWAAGQATGLAASTGGGDLFRRLDRLPSAWRAKWGDDALPLAAALWRHDERLAWTEGVVPLPAPRTDDGDGGWREYRGSWRLRRFVPAADGAVLEVQLALPDARRPWRGTVAEVAHQPGVHSNGAGTLDGEAESSELGVRFRAEGDRAAGRLQGRARLLGVLQVAWVAALLSLAWSPGRGLAFLAACWAGRAFLAAVDLRQAVTASFPGLEFPAAPSTWASLVDPAYFATPVLAGWFACAGDALLTTALLAITAGHPGALRPVHDALRAVGPAWKRRRDWAAAVIAGASAGTALAGWRLLAMLVAENANARLVGPGVSVSYLTFWALHVALLLAALAALRFVWRCIATARDQLGDDVESGVRNRGGRLLAAVGSAAAAGLAVPGQSMPVAAGAAVVVAVAWVGGDLARRRAGLRQLAWPALLLAAALWNHEALRQVYDRAERAWLERRAQGLTEADPAWMRYLVHSALVEMQQADQGRSRAPASGLWRDEPAWRLYRESALADLAYPSLVEILDDEARTASLFGEGFLRDFSYETVSRTSLVTVDGNPAGPDDAVTFQTERRLYSGGQEEILVAEAPRRSGRGWLRLEAPLRSWRVGTMTSTVDAGSSPAGDRYRPRQELDRPVLVLLADDTGWKGSGPEGFPGVENDALVAKLRSGERQWGVVTSGGADWLCRWTALPGEVARTPGEGFLVGIRRETLTDRLLDISRLVLVEALLLVAIALAAALLTARRGRSRPQPGFQEKFLAGYLALGLALLTVVGLSVDRVGYQRVREEARQQAREGLTTALQQMAGLLADGARALVDSGGLDELPLDGSAGADFAPELRGVLLLDGDGAVLFDGSDPPLSPSAAAALLAAARSAPLVLLRDDAGLEAVVAVPVALGSLKPRDSVPPVRFAANAAAAAVLDAGDLDGDHEPGTVNGTAAEASSSGQVHGGIVNDGVLLYGQRLDGSLVAGLAGILRGEVTVSFDGEPVLASHPGGLFDGSRAPLLDPGLMATLFDHPHGAGLASPPGRPFACDAAQPLPAFDRDVDGSPRPRAAPASVGVSFPGREREFAAQRRANVLFLAGLANLILLTALLLAALLSWGLFRPLRVLMGATQSLARGDFEAPLPAAGHDEVGSLAGAFGAMRTRLQEAQAGLAARERFLATVLERVTVGVAVVTPDGALTVANPAGRVILARFWPDLPVEEAARRLRDGLLDAARGVGGATPAASPAAPAVAAELTGDGGRLTLRGALAPLEEAGTEGDLMLVFEDVSEFLATKKLALNAELARQVAHEIKNPLTPIQLSVQLLGQAWNDRHPQLERIVPETVSRVLEQVDLLRRIASEFSLLGRPDDLPCVAIDLPALVGRIAAAYRPGGDPGLVLPSPPPPGLPPVLAHEESLLKILGNLAQNSLDAARPGVAAAVEVAWEIVGGRVRLRWRDNGAGIPADVAGRLFEPYFSTKSKGTGLGLAICRSLAERMGGSLQLADRVDGPGAEAVLELPVAKAGD